MICKNLSAKNSHLHFAGYDTCDLAKKYGTPLMLFDRERFLSNVDTYKNAMKKAFGENSFPLYAGKALCFTHLYRILKETGIGIDVVSSGELFTALSGGFPADKIFFHGNNKTDDDIHFGVSVGIGYFVCDNEDELLQISKEATSQNVIQNVLIRLTPSVDAHTHDAVATGKLDSKFGVAIETGDAEKLVKKALTLQGISLCGFHSHIGSQIFAPEPFQIAARVMADFIIHLKKTLDFDTKILNLGGGIGVRYLESDPDVSIPDIIERVGLTLNLAFSSASLPLPQILMEPGRSLVADCGMTLYSVGAVKEIEGVKNYVSVNGGMADNPRYALYSSPYTIVLANRMDEKCDWKCTVAGRCCESGDILQENVTLPRPNRADVLAVLTTGAYNYSMASNYNRVPRPAVVLLGDTDRVVIKRETPEDVSRLDIIL